MLYRLLKRLYPRVTYVRNITDVDDKINARAAETGEPIDRITAKTTEAFHADMAALGTLPPDVEPRATDHVGPMVETIEVLIDKGHAYEADGHVLFHVPSMADYGRLSRHSRDELIAGARVDVAPYKRDPADFVLWKPSSDDLPGWPSPWGRGRPGWHIECSAMSRAYLGDAFDIHGGGADLIFPHHGERTGPECVAPTAPPFVRYWMHNGYLVVKGDKMSKVARQCADRARTAGGGAGRGGPASRCCRRITAPPLDFSRDTLAEARSGLDRLYRALRDAGGAEPGEPVPAVLSALLDDLNTPAAIAALHETATELNRSEDPEEKAALAAALLGAGELLGLLREDPTAWLHGEGGDAQEIEALVSGTVRGEAGEGFCAGRCDPGCALGARHCAGGRAGRHGLAANGLRREAMRFRLHHAEGTEDIDVPISRHRHRRLVGPRCGGGAGTYRRTRRNRRRAPVADAALLPRRRVAGDAGGAYPGAGQWKLRRGGGGADRLGRTRHAGGGRFRPYRPGVRGAVRRGLQADVPQAAGPRCLALTRCRPALGPAQAGERPGRRALSARHDGGGAPAGGPDRRLFPGLQDGAAGIRDVPRHHSAIGGVRAGKTFAARLADDETGRTLALDYEAVTLPIVS